MTMSKDQIITSYFTKSKIYRLKAEKKRTRLQKMFNFLRFIYVDAEAGITERLLKDVSQLAYLVHQDDRCYLAVVVGETVNSMEISEEIVADVFEYDGWKFTNMGVVEAESR